MLRNRKKNKKSKRSNDTKPREDQNEGGNDNSASIAAKGTKSFVNAIFLVLSALSAIGIFYSLKWKQSLQMEETEETETDKIKIVSKSSAKPFPYEAKLKEGDEIMEQSQDWDSNDPILNQTYDFLANYICNAQDDTEKREGETKPFCHHRLRSAPQRRSHYIVPTQKDTSVKRGETILVLPRRFLILDIDAMRDTFIRNELFTARHKNTDNGLDSGAFLAAYLLMRQRLSTGSWKQVEKKKAKRSTKQQASSGTKEEDKKLQLDKLYDEKESTLLMEYLNMLPTHSAKEHPILWSEEEVGNLLGKRTPSFNLIRGYQVMIESEYKAFCKASVEFKENVNFKDYKVMRLNVMSRSFGPGKPGKEEEVIWWKGEDDSGETDIDGELEYYEKEAGVTLKHGLRAMSPILDMWDHHAKPNVDWIYNPSIRAFEIKAAKGGIKSGHDVMVSYGKYTDTHLFAKFGFVNGDGSGYTEGSIAIMHHPLDIGMGQQFSFLKDDKDDTAMSRKSRILAHDRDIQRQTLAQYLIFDDGYEECIERKANPDGFALKKLKFQHLQEIATIRDRWLFTIAPRNTRSKPAVNSSIPIVTEPPKFNPNKVSFDGSKLISTCRLMTLTNEDFDGKATEVLSSVLKNNTAAEFFVPKQSDELEFRALTCLSRLTTVALQNYDSNVSKEMQLLNMMSSKAVEFRSKEWYAAQVRLGEMQTLEVVRSIASSGAIKMRQQVRESSGTDSSATHIRHVPCSQEFVEDLLKY